MKFSSLLKQPLPSQAGGSVYAESVANELDEIENTFYEGCGEEGCNSTDECGASGCGMEGSDLDDDDFDPDEMSEDELAALDAELGGDEIDDDDDDLGEDEVDLDPEEEMRADDMMSVAATSMLVNDELNAEEKADFISNEAAIALEEGFLTDADIEMLAVEAGLVQEGNNYTKKMIIRLDAASKKKQLYALAVNVSAAAKHDPDYIRLRKVMKMRKILRAKLDRKYHSEAMKRMKVYFARLRRSKSGTLARLGK